MKLLELERSRKEILKEYKKFKKIAFIIDFLVLSVLFYLFYNYIGYESLGEIPAFEKLFLVLFFAFILTFIYKKSINRKKIQLSKPFSQTFKKEYLKEYIKKQGYYYNMYENLDAVDIIRSRLFKPFTHQRGNDYISGIKNGVLFKFSDIILENKLNPYTDIEDHLMEITQSIVIFIQTILKFFKFKYNDGKVHKFTGILFIADFNKNINSKTFVMETKTPRVRNLQLIKMDNPKFNEKFKVYSDDIQNAMYLLSPSLMEKIYRLSQRFKKPINISFIGTKIYISIDTKVDNFEPNLEKNIEIYNPAREIKNDLNSLLEIVDILALDTSLWAKIK